MKKRLFTLIHGTFAANSDWLNQTELEQPSGFRGRLAARFLGQMEFSVPSPWGSEKIVKVNDLTNSARLKGAEKLKEHLLKQDPETTHYLVAHSHGGNVAMYALQDPEVARRVDGLICLATPFLYPRRRPLSILALILSLSIMSLGVLQTIWQSNLLNGGWASWMAALGMIIGAIVIPAALTWLVAYERYQDRLKGDKRLSKLLNKLSFSDPNIPILLIRSSGDEASGLLRGTQFLNWLGGMGLKLGGRQLYVFICIAALLLAWMTYREADVVPEYLIPLLGQLMVASAAVMMILLMALTLSRVFIGLDSWRWVGEIETMVEDGPPGVPSDLVVLSPLEGSQLSHTNIYTRQETIDAIHAWCHQQEASE